MQVLINFHLSKIIFYQIFYEKHTEIEKLLQNELPKDLNYDQIGPEATSDEELTLEKRLLFIDKFSAKFFFRNFRLWQQFLLYVLPNRKEKFVRNMLLCFFGMILHSQWEVVARNTGLFQEKLKAKNTVFRKH